MTVVYNSLRLISLGVLAQAARDYRVRKWRRGLEYFFNTELFDAWIDASGLDREIYLAAVRNENGKNFRTREAGK
jgi:hypothetical protein